MICLTPRRLPYGVLCVRSGGCASQYHARALNVHTFQQARTNVDRSRFFHCLGTGHRRFRNPNSFTEAFDGNVNVVGTLTATVKNAVVPFPDGTQRVLHCRESPELWFEDFGTAQLRNGRAVVKLDDKTLSRVPDIGSKRALPTANFCELAWQKLSVWVLLAPASRPLGQCTIALTRTDRWKDPRSADRYRAAQ